MNDIVKIAPAVAKNALDRARDNAPFLAMLLDREPDLAATLAQGALPLGVAAAFGEGR